MKEVGFVKTSMPGETRVALLPEEIQKVEHPGCLFFEEGYARSLGIGDFQYSNAGARVVGRGQAYRKEVVCIPKPWKDDLIDFQHGQIAAGWFYLAEKVELKI